MIFLTPVMAFERLRSSRLRNIYNTFFNMIYAHIYTHKTDCSRKLKNRKVLIFFLDLLSFIFSLSLS